MTGLDQPVIFIEDDEQLRLATSQALEIAGLTVRAFDHAEAALGIVSGAFDGAIVSDIRMPGMDGLETLAGLRAFDMTQEQVALRGEQLRDVVPGADLVVRVAGEVVAERVPGPPEQVPGLAGQRSVSDGGHGIPPRGIDDG